MEAVSLGFGKLTRRETVRYSKENQAVMKVMNSPSQPPSLPASLASHSAPSGNIGSGLKTKYYMGIYVYV